MWSKDGSFEKFKTQKHIIKMTQSVDATETKERRNKKPKKSKRTKEDTMEQEEDVSNKLSHEEEIIKHDNVNSTPEKEHTPEPEVEIPKEKFKTTKTFTPKTFSETPMEDDPVLDLNETTSPHFSKNHPRRSMRTPKPIKRTPEQSKQSVKKLTVTATKLQKSTPRGTPKKAKAKP